MKNRWSDADAEKFADNDLSLRVYTSRLLGDDPSLVLHGGGNTSVKVSENDFFGNPVDLLYVKGSGWDLATIEAAGFAPVRMETLLKLAECETLSDTDMVLQQRAAMSNPEAPNASVEAILHAIIPFKFVDHTHANVMVAITNPDGGEARVKEIYGDRVLVVPYVMPGFILARTIYEMTRDTDWTKYDGMVLLNHGIFSFGDDAKTSYDRMIELVGLAESYLADKGAGTYAQEEAEEDLVGLAALRKEVSKLRGTPVLARINQGSEAVGFSAQHHVDQLAGQGPLTPDHIIRTKQLPLIVDEDPAGACQGFAEDYQKYFDTHNDGSLTCLPGDPRWAVWRRKGTVAFGTSLKEANIIRDINEHTVRTIQDAEQLGGWKALSPKDLFEMEYWELEQAKLKKGGSAKPLQGKVAVITGCAAGIGFACAQALHDAGAVVVGLDLNPVVEKKFSREDFVGMICNVTDNDRVESCLAETVRRFGGIDILVSNAGIFTAGAFIEQMDGNNWDKSIAVNLTSHQRLMQFAIPYLRHGIDASIVVIGSRNVRAPGAGAAAYSCAKAGITQLVRVAAMELAQENIRVNIIHPDAVFDTELWTEENLNRSAERYGLTVEEYKTRNLMKCEVTSADVGELLVSVIGPAFKKTTGAQIPIDGGNDRVI